MANGYCPLLLLKGKIMNCPKCQAKTAVIDSRPHKGTVRRRRKCKKCGHRLTTYETTNSKFVEGENRRLKTKIKELQKDVESAYGAFLK